MRVGKRGLFARQIADRRSTEPFAHRPRERVKGSLVEGCRPVENHGLGPGRPIGLDGTNDRIDGANERRLDDGGSRLRRVHAVCSKDAVQDIARSIGGPPDHDRRGTDGTPDGARVAANFRAVAVQDPVPTADRVRIALAVPDVGCGRNDPQRSLLARPADQQRQLPERRGIVARGIRRHPAPRHSYGLAVEQPPDRPRLLLEPRDPVSEGRIFEPECPVLGLVPAGPEPDRGALHPDARSAATSSTRTTRPSRRAISAATAISNAARPSAPFGVTLRSSRMAAANARASAAYASANRGSLEPGTGSAPMNALASGPWTSVRTSSP